MRLLVSRHLENFLALYEARNMHVAAVRKGITQPALTKSLRALEDEVGNDLFKRTAKGLEPTETGTALFRYARAIDQEARFASLDLQRSSFEAKGLLRIGVGPALAVTTFPRVLVQFHRLFPGVQVTVETGITRRLVESVLRGDLDVMVSAKPEKDLPELFTAVDLFDHGMAVICRRDHPLRMRQTVSVRDLAAYGQVGFLEDFDFGDHLRRTYGRRIDGMKTVMRTNSTAVMLEVLAATEYFAIVNEVMVPRAMREGLLPLKVHDLLWDIQIQLICRLAFIDSRPIRSILATYKRSHLQGAASLLP